MSTKAIRAALDHMEACDTGTEAPLVAAARVEIAAIEAAALEFYENGRDAHYDVAFNLMDAIAKQND